MERRKLMENENTAPEKFVIYDTLDSNGKEKIWKSRSISISTDILARLNKLETEHQQYIKKTILDAVIDRGLRDFGY